MQILYIVSYDLDMDLEKLQLAKNIIDRRIKIAHRISANNYSSHQLYKNFLFGKEITKIDQVIDIFCYLLNDSPFANAFWNFYIDALNFNDQYYLNLKTEDIKNILDALIKNKHGETTENFIEYIQLNGLLRSTTRRHLENKSVLEVLEGHGAQAEIFINEKYLSNAVSKGKDILFHFICLFYGLDFLKLYGMEHTFKINNALNNDEKKFFNDLNLISKTKKKYLDTYNMYMDHDWTGNNYQYQDLYNRLTKFLKINNYDPEEYFSINNKAKIRDPFSEIPAPHNLIKHYYSPSELNLDDNEMDNFISQAYRQIISALRWASDYICYRHKFINAEEMSMPLEEFHYLSNIANIKNLKNEFDLFKNTIKDSDNNYFIDIGDAKTWLKDVKRNHEFYDSCPMNLTEDSNFESFVDEMRDEIYGNRSSAHKKIRRQFNDSDRFIRTNKPIPERAASHNKKRWQQIGKRKNGYTFKELNEVGSFYRDCIKIKGFNKKSSSIFSSLNYDLDNEWIEEI